MTGISADRLREMLRKEFIQVLRDPRMRFLLFGVPVVQMLVFGYAATNDVRNVPTAVFDLDGTPESRELVARFPASGYFRVREYVRTEDRVRALLDRGEVTALLRLDPGFGADVRAGRSAAAKLIVDGTDSNTAAVVLDYASKIVRGYSDAELERRSARVRGAARPPGGVSLARRVWFNQNLESRNFFVPGVIANLVLIVTLTLTSMAVVREKEIGTMEQIMVTPIRPLEFILGKTIPFALIGFFEVTLISLVGVGWFEIPIRGSLVVLGLGTCFYLMSTLGAGLLISTVSETQQQAMMTTFFFVFPAILLSGFAFPVANMPLPVQWFTYVNPVRHFVEIIRAVFLKGVGLDVLWPQMAALLGIGVVTLGLASARFRKTLA